MSQQRPIDRAIDGIADGVPIDWDRLDREVPDEERELLQCLRMLGGIADLHRSTSDEEVTDQTHPLPSSSGSSEATSEDGLESWGRYLLSRNVGEGSFGSVYCAWDPELEREIAIKILHSLLADPSVTERLLREGRALAKVRHPNVVSVFGVEAHGGRVGLCMEFIRGETLESALLTHGPLNAREAILVGEDVCRALVAVHAAGFVHRDVKARNVMRERAGRIVLMDFGTGRQAEELKVSGRVGMAGTPLYMAPEVLAGLPASPSSDVYSVGVLLYHLVTSGYPVEGGSIEALRAAHMQGRRLRLSERRADLPMSFIHVVDRALAADPSQRHSSAGELLEALGHIDGSEGRPSLARYVPMAVLGALGAAFLAIGLGAASSRQLNARLGRSEFVSETVWDWFYWGAASSLAPGVQLLIVLVSIALLLVFRHVLLTASARAGSKAARKRASFDFTRFSRQSGIPVPESR